MAWRPEDVANPFDELMRMTAAEAMMRRPKITDGLVIPPTELEPEVKDVPLAPSPSQFSPDNAVKKPVLSPVAPKPKAKAPISQDLLASTDPMPLPKLANEEAVGRPELADQMLGSKPSIWGDGFGEQELEIARDEDRKRRMGVGLMQALSSGIGSMTGAKSDADFWKQQMENAEQGERSILEGRKRRAETLSLEKATTKMDPKSAESVAARKFLADAGLKVPETMTAEQAEANFPIMKEILSARNEKEKTRIAAEAKAAEESAKAERENRKEMSALEREERETYMQGVGRFATKEDRAKYAESATEALGTRNDINALREIGKMSEWGARMNLNDRAKAQTRIAALVGKLRVPLTGPGVLTEKERADLISIIGNPTEFFSIPEVTRTKLNELDKAISESLKTRAKAYDVDTNYVPKAFRKTHKAFDVGAERTDKSGKKYVYAGNNQWKVKAEAN